MRAAKRDLTERGEVRTHPTPRDHAGALVHHTVHAPRFALGVVNRFYLTPVVLTRFPSRLACPVDFNPRYSCLHVARQDWPLPLPAEPASSKILAIPIDDFEADYLKVYQRIEKEVRGSHHDDTPAPAMVLSAAS